MNSHIELIDKESKDVIVISDTENNERTAVFVSVSNHELH